MYSIKPFVTAKIYKNEFHPSFGFIYDERMGTYYLLKGESADLWGLILSNQGANDLFKIANTNDLKLKLTHFLFELYNKEFIDIDESIFANTYSDNYKYLNKIYGSKGNFTYVDYAINTYISKNNLLRILTLQLSYKCNLYCKHCFNPKNMPEYEISFETAKKAIDEAYNLGITEVCITGGECTINENFLKIAKYVRNKHLRLTFLTNAQRLYDDKLFFDEIANIFPHRIEISLYSMDPVIHDNLTGVSGSHNKTFTVIKKLREKNINVAVKCFQSSLNKNSYIEVTKFAKSIGAKITSDCVFVNNRDNNNYSCKLSEKDIEDFYYNQMNSDESFFFRPEFKKGDDLISQIFGNASLYLAPNSDISISSDSKYKLGNYKNNSLCDIVNNSLPKLREVCIRKNLKECFTQDYCSCCAFPYCIIAASYDAGEFQKSEILCEDARAYYHALKRFRGKKNTSLFFAKFNGNSK